MTPCARTHSVPGQHAPGCTCTQECREHENHCKGCLPVEADRGLLCRRCAQRLEDFLGASEGLAEGDEEPIHGLPWAYDHLDNAMPSLSQAPGSGGSSIEDAEAQRLANVVSLRADMHLVLQKWTFVLMRAPYWLAGPDIPTSERLTIRRCAAFLLQQAERIESLPAVAEAWQELADLMSRAHALAPWRPAPTKLEGIPCRCGALALHDHGTEVVCWSCRANYDREHYRALTAVFARRFADDPRAQHVRSRLEASTAGFGGRP